MQNVSSDISLIRWTFTIVLSVFLSMVTIWDGGLIKVLVWVSLMLIVLTMLRFFEEKNIVGTTLKITLFTLGLWFIEVSGFAWWAGFVFLAVFEGAGMKSTPLKVTLASVFSTAAMALGSYFSHDKMLTMVRHEAILLFAVIIYMLLVHLIAKYTDMSRNYQKALEMSALESLTERKLREELSYKMAQEEMNARLKERERISRDIHNSVGHTLSAASVTLDAAKLLADSDTEMSKEKMTVANDRIKESIDSIRSVVRTLDSVDDSVNVKDYLKSLGEMTSNFAMDTDVKVFHNFEDIDDEGSIDIQIASFISGAISELLTNGMKHGNATVFVIIFTMDTKHISVKVQDNGNGFGEITFEERQRKLDEGFGLRKMEDQISSWGGMMNIDGSDGFKVMINLPRVTKETVDGKDNSGR